MKKIVIWALGVFIVLSYSGCLLQKQQTSAEFQDMFANNFSVILDDAMKANKKISQEEREIFGEIIKKAIEETVLAHMTADEIKELNSIFSSPKFQGVIIKAIKGNALTQDEKKFLSDIQQVSTGFQKFTSKTLQKEIIDNIGKKLEQLRLEKISAKQ